MTKRKHHVDIHTDALGQWRWTRYAGNGKIIGTSGEGYANREHAVEMAKLVNGDIEVIVPPDK